MRIGMTLFADRDVAGLARLAAAAERAGFDDVWWPDHYMHRDIGAVLTACALATERVRLGSAVSSPLLRHPAALASLYASLAEVAPGRIVAGVGPGGWELPVQLGIHESKPRSITRESAMILRDMLDGGVATAASEAGRFPVSGAKLDFAPPQPVPLYLAARGPRMMSLAGELADGLITHSLSLPFVEHVIERVKSAAERHRQRTSATPDAGDSHGTSATSDAFAPGAPHGPGGAPDAGDCSVAVWLEVCLHDDLDHARDVLRPRCRFLVGGEFDPQMIPLYGLDVGEVMRVRKALRAGDPAVGELITDDMVDAFSICGSVERVSERLKALQAAGVSELILSFGPSADPDEIASVGEQVLAFRDRFL